MASDKVTFQAKGGDNVTVTYTLADGRQLQLSGDETYSTSDPGEIQELSGPDANFKIVETPSKKKEGS
jgi:hypothetical protein